MHHKADATLSDLVLGNIEFTISFSEEGRASAYKL